MAKRIMRTLPFIALSCARPPRVPVVGRRSDGVPARAPVSLPGPIGSAGRSESAPHREDRDIAANAGHGGSSRRPSIAWRGALGALALGRRAAAKPYQLRLMAPPAFLEAGEV